MLHVPVCFFGFWLRQNFGFGTQENTWLARVGRPWSSGPRSALRGARSTVHSAGGSKFVECVRTTGALQVAEHGETSNKQTNQKKFTKNNLQSFYSKKTRQQFFIKGRREGWLVLFFLPWGSPSPGQGGPQSFLSLVGSAGTRATRHKRRTKRTFLYTTPVR